MRLAVLLAALGTSWGQSTGAIEGTVNDAASHAPVANARVTVNRAGTE